MNHERHIALRDGHQNTDAEAFFAARPELGTHQHRMLFEQGYKRGFDAASELNAALLDEVQRKFRAISDHTIGLVDAVNAFGALPARPGFPGLQPGEDVPLKRPFNTKAKHG